MHSKSKPSQSVLITGGGTGIGLAFAKELLKQGYGTLILGSRRREILETTATGLRSQFPNQRILTFAFDLRDRSQTESIVQFAFTECGVVDVLINNSGLAVPETIDKLTDDGWNTVMETNLRGAMWLTQMVLPAMVQQDFGDIVNVSSQAGKHGYADVPSYCASKFGLLGFAEAVRDDVCKNGRNIRVFNLCPALVDVESDESSPPRPGFLHVRAMAQTLGYALGLDRNVVLHDIGLSGR